MAAHELFREITGGYRTEAHEDMVFVHRDRPADVYNGPKTLVLKLPFGSRAYAVDRREKRLETATPVITADNQLYDDVLAVFRYLVSNPEAAIRNLPANYENELSMILQSKIRAMLMEVEGSETREKKADFEGLIQKDSELYIKRWGLKPTYFALERFYQRISLEMAEEDRQHMVSMRRLQHEADLKYLDLLNETARLEGPGLRRARAQTEIELEKAKSRVAAELLIAKGRAKILEEMSAVLGEKVTPDNLAEVLRALDGYARGDKAYESRFKFRHPFFGSFVSSYGGWWDRIGHFGTPEDFDRRVTEELFGD